MRLETAHLALLECRRGNAWRRCHDSKPSQNENCPRAVWDGVHGWCLRMQTMLSYQSDEHCHRLLTELDIRVDHHPWHLPLKKQKDVILVAMQWPGHLVHSGPSVTVARLRSRHQLGRLLSACCQQTLTAHTASSKECMCRSRPLITVDLKCPAWQEHSTPVCGNGKCRI